MIKPQTMQKLVWIVLWTAALITVAVLIMILGYILFQGAGKLSWEFLTAEPKAMGAEGGIFSIIVSTVIFVLVTIIFSAPVGIAAAIYLAEYTGKNVITGFIRFGTDALSGVPSIVFGLFGFAFFVIILKPVTGGWSLISGAMTVACMILPTIIRTAEEAIKAVPTSYREGSYALGATQWTTIIKIIIPAALPGIITGIILGVGRIVGETAALLLTLGGSMFIPVKLTDPANTMSMHLYKVAMEVGAMDMAFATAAVLIMTILLINLGTSLILRVLNKKRA